MTDNAKSPCELAAAACSDMPDAEKLGYWKARALAAEEREVKLQVKHAAHYDALLEILRHLGECDQHDHHGQCQTHWIENPCPVKAAWALYCPNRPDIAR